ncbi:methyltransferase domain-containing protein [Halobaculum sp. EA56]|uniref:methyltransferase domain-containing protein n=1 Tax=Halobaculum sp. EA56 TaxID=3421648 RepID=UPI003EBCFB92
MTGDYDEADARAEEAAYETAGAAQRRRFVRDSLDPATGDRILSVGCGPGFEPRELAEAVGPDGSVLGVDRSPAMTALARERLAPVPNAGVVAGDATRLPVADGVADAAVAVQVFQYLDRVDPALAELSRVLAPDGRAAVFLADWDTFVVRGADPDRTDRVLGAWSDHCVRPTLGSRLPEHLDGVDLAVSSVEPYALSEPDPTGDAFARHLLGFVAEFVADHDAVGADEAASWRESLREAADDGEAFVSLTGHCYLLEPTPAGN